MNKGLVFVIGLILSLSSGAQSKASDGFEVVRLSPVPADVTGVQEAIFVLNGQWDFHIGDSGIIKRIQVPGEWEMQGFTVNEGETAVYSREIVIPDDWMGKRIKIRFDGVSSHAVVRFNGMKLGEHEGSFVPFEADLTSAAKPGRNLLEVEVKSLSISDRLACTSQYAVHTVGGILRKATLFVLPETNISGITVSTHFDSLYRKARLRIKTSLENESANSEVVSLRFTLIDNDGKQVLQKVTAPVSCGSFSACNLPEVTLPVMRPRHWNPEQPYLYKLQTELLLKGKVTYAVSQKIGFRQIEIKGNQLLVNGKAIKLHGVNRHSIYPLTGRSISAELERKDAVMFRAANCNYIRTSHYPPSEEFLNACDELGLFVESEASLCWIQHGASPIWRLWNYLDEKYLPYMVRANIDNVLAGKNHPSVIIWSLGNESRWSPLWETVNLVVKKIDPTRPTSFHDQCWGGYNNAGSKADIANYHYPGINGPAATDTMSRPVLFGEYAHLTTYNRRELVSDPGVRSAYNLPLVKFYDSIYHHRGNLGGAIWSGIDDIFHMPDGRIIGYGPWGPLDAWRRPKPEYWGMKKAYSPVRVTNINWSALQNGYIELFVENRYDFISLDQVKIKVSLDGVEKTVAATIPARGKGTIRIPAHKDATKLYVSFSDPRGFIADEERYLKDEPAPNNARKTEVSYTENESAIFVKQGVIRYTISKSTGIITSVKKGEKLLMTQGPVFCVIPMNREDGGKPNVAGETYQNTIHPVKVYPLYTIFASSVVAKQIPGGVEVSLNVTYNNSGSGMQSYVFSENGSQVTEYEIEYKGSDSIPYQYGLLMQLPATMDKLSWKRKGEFTTYPDNDIARTEGETMLNARNMHEVEEWGVIPEVDWKDDANGLGSNDFRSTKRYVISASLQNREGDAVTINSDGTQSSRSWLQDGRIHWLIADYSNSGSEPFYGTPHSDGRINIKRQKIKGKLVTIFE